MRASKQAEPIQVWRFNDAPERLRKLSQHGGDEDWVALVPPKYAEVYIPCWLREGTSFGCCDVSEDKLPDGSTVYIGAHA